MFSLLVGLLFWAEEASGEVLHEVFEDEKDNEAGGNDDAHDDEVLGSQEDKFEEVTDEGDAKGGSHDADDGEKEGGAESV